ncbi:galacturan 1,4-alpha-galacturonidase B [Fusarium sp. MPI-SDFR-AT-0072]|nr:galacturan 1,4-alpha-galacturonidase B [Fusarium sp. MPI-SDFR-AT-0072]
MTTQVFATKHLKTCVIKAGGSNITDDAPAIREAFKRCGRGERVVFKPTTYHISSVLNITGLKDVEVDIQGKLLWSIDIDYWLKNSLDVGFQNQSTAFILGGDNLVINGHGTGNLDRNGDYWYQWIRQQPNSSNYPGRPYAITFNGLTNSVVRGLSFLRSQMCSMSIISSHHVDFHDIFINNTGNKYQSCVIALKRNSTDISITNSKFYDGLGIVLGSLGQYYEQLEIVQRLNVKNCYFENTLHALYVKTWTDDRNRYPPNGGGGGRGYTKEIVAKNLRVSEMRGAAFAISQCTRFKGAPGDSNCTNSKFQARDITIAGLHGTTNSKRVASLQCSPLAPCTGLGLFGVDLKKSDGKTAEEYLCGNVKGNRGFECTGKVCEGGISTGEC